MCLYDYARPSMRERSKPTRDSSVKNRPFFRLDIENLEQVFEDGHTDTAILQYLTEELIFRKTSRAKRLTDAINRHLANRTIDSGSMRESATDSSANEPCLCCRRGQPGNCRKICPECGHVFQGKGWDGIDAHWRAKHEDVMPYEAFWESLCARHR